MVAMNSKVIHLCIIISTWNSAFFINIEELNPISRYLSKQLNSEDEKYLHEI